MQHQVKAQSAEGVLSRVLECFEAEILASSDEELLEAAADLRMDPRMKGSAAFAGIRYPEDPGRSAAFFGLDQERLAALQGKFRLQGREPAWPDDEHPDFANVAEWVALIRQLRGK